MSRTAWRLLAGGVTALFVALPGGSAPVTGQQVHATATSSDAPVSSHFSTARIDEHESVGTTSDGDLWPSCWSDDGNLYAANGDGRGFSTGGDFADVAVSRISGGLPHLTGRTLARGDQVSSTWSGPRYNRKPTGMVCVDGTIYLAVQDLALDFNSAPAATIVKSTDHGRTWTWDRSRPMFGNHVFTTIWFADFGKGGGWAPDRYVYVYGLDNNWRDSFDDSVPDPTDVYLVRVPRMQVQNRAAWQFYTGRSAVGSPRWSANIAARTPVLHDGRRLYRQTYSPDHISDLSVISQGGVTYDRPLRRYIYTSWTEYTFEFYESPTPWGPWKRFLSKDFGAYPWSATKHGGYATTIPSKFLSADGRSMYVQSNVCPCAAGGTAVYHYSLRRLELTPNLSTDPTNQPAADVNLAAPPTGAVPVSKSARLGRLDVLNDGTTSGSEDDNDDEVKGTSWWGYTWPRRYTMNQVDFTTGQLYGTGGWFSGRPQVQLRQDGRWVNATAQNISPAYPGDSSAGALTAYTITFLPAAADGVRVIGVPGGSRTFTSISELAVRYTTRVADSGFEAAAGGRSAWAFEGNANHGVDRGAGFAHSGRNNGWVRTAGTGWSALTQQVPVTPGRTYTFTAWTRSSPALTDGRFGVRQGGTVLGESRFAATAGYTQRQVQVTVPPGTRTVTVYIGMNAPGTDTWVQVDDVSAVQAG